MGQGSGAKAALPVQIKPQQAYKPKTLQATTTTRGDYRPHDLTETRREPIKPKATMQPTTVKGDYT